eukprot:Ihof_evm1s715 gene=Ihof_evmTU1s715
MAGRVVHSSKFRHVFGSLYRQEECNDNIAVTGSTWDSNFCDVNEKSVTCILESGGGGAFVAMRHDQIGKMTEFDK